MPTKFSAIAIKNFFSAGYDADIAMIKDEMVAARNGGKVFDLVCRFR